MEIRGAGALVAGGASGLGAATSRLLAEAGAKVTIADLNAERGEALAAEIGGEFVAADVTDAESVGAAVERAAVDGGLRISACCAGIGWAERLARSRGPHDLEYFSNVVKVNLIGTFNVLRLAKLAKPSGPLKLKLTKAGKKLLGKSGKLKIALNVWVTPAGQKTVHDHSSLRLTE